MLSPEEIVARINEYLTTPPSMPLRKLQLGLELHDVTTQTADRLTRGAYLILSGAGDESARSYWMKLHGSWNQAKAALSLTDLQAARVAAAKLIFKADEVETEREAPDGQQSEFTEVGRGGN